MGRERRRSKGMALVKHDTRLDDDASRVRKEPTLGGERARAPSTKDRTRGTSKTTSRADAPSLVRGLQNLTDKAFGRTPASAMANAPRTNAQIVAAIAHDALAFARVLPVLMGCREISPVTARRPSDRHARKPGAARARAAAVPRLLSCHPSLAIAPSAVPSRKGARDFAILR